MGLSRVSDRYASDKATAKTTAEFQLNFIGDNLKHLRKVDKTGKYERDYMDIAHRFKQGEELMPNTLSYIDSIYEKVWKGANFASVNTHVDKKRRGLRFGR